MRNMKVTKICEKCGAEFKCSPSHASRRKNCSRACADQKGQTNTGRTHFKKGYVPWNKGKKYSTGKNWTEEWRNRFTSIRKGHIVTEETRRKISATQHGIELEEWKGFTSRPRKFEYSREFLKIRKEIIKRDDFTCNICSSYGKEVHHIDYNKQNNSEDNLITLCHSCHSKTNHRREDWVCFFEDLNVMKGGKNIMEENIMNYE